MHDEIVQELHDYCQHSKAEINMVVEQFIKSWTSNPSIQKKFWKNTDNVREDYRKMLDQMDLPPNEINSIGIDSKKARGFHQYCEKYGFDPAKMATYLGGMYINMHRIQEMNDYHEREDKDRVGSIY